MVKKAQGGGAGPDLQGRYRRFLEKLEEQDLEGFLVTHPPNLHYLFGFTGSAGWACCVQGEAALFVDSRYLQQARQQGGNCQVLLARESLEETLGEWLKRRSPSRLRLGVESSRLTLGEYRRLADRLENVELVETSGLVESLRVLKDPYEIALLEEAFRRALRAWQEVEIRAGMSEIEVAGQLEHLLRRQGAQGYAFETIVASGPRSALPHGLASERIIRADDLVLVDFGMRYQGYCTDLTRICYLPQAVIPEIHQVVARAQAAALAAIRPGVSTREVDAAARELIREAGYGEYFGHGTGHGLGLEVHEAPHLSYRRGETLREGMVLTVEPGIYLPERYGVRLEDVVVVTRQGCRLLSAPGAAAGGSG